MDENNEKKPLDIIQEDGGEKETREDSTSLALGLCFGSAIGLILQILTGNAIWLSIGVTMGLSISCIWNKKK